MKKPHLTIVPPPLDQQEEAAHIERLLNDACGKYCKTGRSGLWGFTITSVLFLVKWLSMMKPRETREYLLALADLAIADDPLPIAEATMQVHEKQATLIDALTTRGMA